MPRTGRLLLILALMLAAIGAATVPLMASGSEGARVAQGGDGVPAATRFCGQGGDPSRVGNGADPRGVNPSSANPLAGLRLYNHKIQDPAYQDLVRYRRSGQSRKAALMERIALTPRGVWFGRFTRPNFRGKVQDHLNCAQFMEPGSIPLMTVMRHQGRACNARYQGGGVAEDNASKRWYREFRSAVGDARVIIAFEPDSIGTIECLAKSRRRARMNMLRYGVNELSKLPNATIYLEGSASDWKNPRFTARMLKYIGIRKVRGFMLNVTHFDWTENNIRYGRRVSRLVGGKPFVVSTSYNGRGPVHYTGRRGKRVNVFCNVRFRGTGPKPNTRTGQAKVDAYLWINRPGLSAAGKRNGAPGDGIWWPARALMYARYATERLRPAPGSRFGFKRRISLCRLGAPRPNGRYYTSAPERRCR
jgi:endoglucanase